MIVNVAHMGIEKPRDKNTAEHVGHREHEPVKAIECWDQQPKPGSFAWKANF